MKYNIDEVFLLPKIELQIAWNEFLSVLKFRFNQNDQNKKFSLVS